MKVLTGLALGSSATLTVAHSLPDCASEPLSTNGVCDTSLSPRERAEALVQALETDEKLTLLANSSPGVERVGLPSYEWWQEALHGVADSPGIGFADSGDFSYATSFPQPILMGAAFDDSLIEAVATVISTEARAFNNFERGGLDYWTPNINPFKDPRWGRGQETPGEDPFHLSSYVTSLIRGLQGGDDPDVLKLVATCKHYAGYDLESWGGVNRYEFDAIITAQDLSEFYTPSFEACVRANAGSFMCTYNAVNGVPTCASPYLQQDILREYWGWNRDYQYITSDCGAIDNIYDPHNYTDTPEEAVAAALLSGTDLDCGDYYNQYLPGALSQGLIEEGDLDKALTRLYSGLVKVGYFDPADSSSSAAYRSLDFSDVMTPEAEELARVAAEKGIVLIKNDDSALPLDSSANMTIAMYGSLANAQEEMQGNYYGVAKYLHSPLYAAQQIPAFSIIDGGNLTNATTSAAESADVVIIFDGLTNDDESEGRDRQTIGFTDERIEIINNLAAEAGADGKPCILVTMGGGQVDTAPFLTNDNISAVMWAGYPGQAGGDAIMNVIAGAVAPAGRLPLTQYPAEYAEQVDMTDMALRPDDTTGNPGRTYIWYSGEPTVPFGHGLHYTEFEVDASFADAGDLSWDTASLVSNCQNTTAEREITLCSFQDVLVQVSNVGEVTSDFVVLGFIAGEHGPEPFPNKRLVAYTRLNDVEANGEAATEAHLALTLDSLARRDDAGDLVLYPGQYEFLVDVPVRTSFEFELTGEAVTLREWPQETAL